MHHNNLLNLLNKATAAAANCFIFTQPTVTVLRYFSVAWMVKYIITENQIENIARGTTDPEIDYVTWTKFGNHMAPLVLVANLATRWRHLH